MVAPKTVGTIGTIRTLVQGLRVRTVFEWKNRRTVQIVPMVHVTVVTAHRERNDAKAQDARRRHHHDLERRAAAQWASNRKRSGSDLAADRRGPASPSE